MTDVDGVSSRWHSNFSRNRSIFPSRLVFSSRFVLPCFLLLLLKRERVGSRAGASSCKNTNKIWWDGGWSRAEAGCCTGMIKKVQTTAERHFARKRTTLAFMRAIMREHRLSGPCCRKRRPFSSRPFEGRYFSQFRVGGIRWERRKGEKRAEKGKDRGELVEHALSLWRCFFIFFFPRSTKGYDTKERETHYATYELFHSLSVLVEFSFNRDNVLRARENVKRILQKFSIALKENERRKFGRREGSLSLPFSLSLLRSLESNTWKRRLAVALYRLAVNNARRHTAARNCFASYFPDDAGGKQTATAWREGEEGGGIVQGV